MKQLFFTTICLLFSYKNFGQKPWTIYECINYGKEHSLLVKRDNYDLLIQSKNLEIAKRDILPSISANLNNVSTFGQDQDIFGDIKRNDNLNSTSRVGGQITLFNNGKLRKNISKNQFDTNASIYELEATQIEISAQILQAYLQVLLNKDIAKANESSVDNAKKLYLKAVSATELGITPKTVEYEAKANLTREEQKLQIANNDVSRNLLDLAILLQLDDYEDFDIEDIEFSLNDPKNFRIPDLKNLIESSYTYSPTLKSFEDKIKSYKIQTEIIKTGLSPTVTLNADVGTFYFNSLVRENDDNFFKQYGLHFSQQVVIRVNIPIFNKGITNLQIERSKLNEGATNNLLNIEKQKVRQTIQKNFFELKTNYENYIKSIEVEKNTRLSFELAEQSFMEGFTTIYDLNISRNNWVATVSNTIQFRYKYLFSLNLLYLYTGEPIQL